MAFDLGIGTTIVFGTSGFSADILSIDGWDRTREKIETTHMGTTSEKTFTPSALSDPGELSLTIHFLGSEAEPIGLVPETITIDWGGSGNTWSGSGFVTSYSPQAPIEDRMTASMTIAFSGAIS